VAQLTVRNVPEEVVRALRVRAARRGRSAEAEHRQLLAEALKTDMDDFWTRADSLRSKSRRQRTESGRLQRAMREER
jgi:plasmid stability protein